ncbi:CCA tRNA nucleotidyltransferase [Methanospirillum lacunae]|uniref:CCA-adding enzyme n=1 Tax=Methanospirillum lacunae TaxID=668570 RepID=A0A2V2N732_9EURY|nr:CCA tRNA nucleotidyltransferase [Methanospirillum lacunae]PWR72037.1 CCA tRNA nucleotidyltransferase [Methanospirillum lacunae]
MSDQTKRTSLEEEVLKEIRPTTEDLDQMYALADLLIGEINTGGRATGMLVGSVARRTCVRGDRDLDIFMLFDPDLPREELEREGLSLAHSIASRHAEQAVEKYAEHPYVNATIRGMDIDLVPCYQVASATGIQSAVDRTPFHNRYISARIGPFTDDVLLLKQFVKAGGVYGSDQMTEGFAGYLCELLTLHYGGFINLITAGANWRPGLVIDIEKHQAKEFDDPLVVIDPVDPKRNVSASVSLTKLLEFSELCRGYLESPSRWFFYRPPVCIMTREEAEAELSRRGSYLYAIMLPTPPLIEDIVVPQLRKSMQTLTELLERHEFVVARADAEMLQDRSMILYELLVDTLPAVRYHAGPPANSSSNARKFLDKYIYDAAIFAGPFIKDGRYGVEIQRKFRTVRELFSSKDIFQTALGKHVKLAMEEEYTILSGMECWAQGFEIFVSDFLMKRSPLVRIRRMEEQQRIN